jgi:hypothetical protein
MHSPSYYVPCPFHPPRLDQSRYLAKSTGYESPHNAVFFNLLSLHLSSVEIFSSASCSKISLAYYIQIVSAVLIIYQFKNV